MSTPCRMARPERVSQSPRALISAVGIVRAMRACVELVVMVVA